ncbi:MAG: PilN domain-containing protein [Vicinamibacteraceae bacterium]
MTMLRTNLATKPFYNERVLLWLIGGATLLVIAFTAFNVGQYLRLSGRQGGLAADSARDEAAARTLAARAVEARRRIDAKSLERISAQAAEANGIIDARTFSWTTLFDDIEATLPPNVMLTQIAPSIGPDGATVRLTVLGRTVEAIDTFIEKLEATSRFDNVQPSTESVTEEGLFETLVTGRYLVPGPAAAPTAPSTPTPMAPSAPGRQGAR